MRMEGRGEIKGREDNRREAVRTEVVPKTQLKEVNVHAWPQPHLRRLQPSFGKVS